MEQAAEISEPNPPGASAGPVAHIIERSPSAAERVRIPLSRLPEAWQARLRTGRAWISERTPNKRQVSLASFVMMGVSDAASMTGKFKGVPITLFGTGAGLGLILTSLHDMRRSEEPHGKLDAASNLAWGYQGLLALSSSAVVQQTARGFGVTGALIQTTMGVTRIRKGYRERDGLTMKVGALDVGGGLLWLGWDLLAMQQPLLVGSYVLLGVTKEGLANRSAVKGFARKARDRAQRAWRACTEVVDAVVAGAADDAEQVLRQLQAPALATARAGAPPKEPGPARSSRIRGRLRIRVRLPSPGRLAFRRRGMLR